MTPQEKAKQLVDYYMDLSEEQEYDTPRYMPKEMAVKCALIAVNEIKTLLYNADRMYQYDYWMEVKKEIEKL
jgi:hypothetical protein